MEIEKKNIGWDTLKNPTTTNPPLENFPAPISAVHSEHPSDISALSNKIEALENKLEETKKAADKKLEDTHAKLVQVITSTDKNLSLSIRKTIDEVTGLCDKLNKKFDDTKQTIKLEFNKIKNETEHPISPSKNVSSSLNELQTFLNQVNSRIDDQQLEYSKLKTTLTLWKDEQETSLK